MTELSSFLIGLPWMEMGEKQFPDELKTSKAAVNHVTMPFTWLTSLLPNRVVVDEVRQGRVNKALLLTLFLFPGLHMTDTIKNLHL